MQPNAARIAVAAMVCVLCAPAPAQERPYISSQTEITLMSVNDGGAFALSPSQSGALSKANYRDSITAIHIGPDHPPIV